MRVSDFLGHTLAKGEVPPPNSHPVLAGGNFAFISGEEPAFPPEIPGGHKGLQQLLAQAGHKFEHTDATYQGKNVPMFIVHGVNRGQAMDLGRRMGQESVIFSNAGQHELIYANGPLAGKYHPSAGGHQFFAAAPDDGVATRIPNVGFVRFNFDHGKTVDVPKEGSEAMSDQNTQKSEVSVPGLRQALAKSIKNAIDRYSKHLEDLAKREVEQSDGQPIVGELPLLQSQLEVGEPSSAEQCPLCQKYGYGCPCVTQLQKSMAKGSLEAKLGTGKTDHIAAQAPVGGNTPNPPAMKAELCKGCGMEKCSCVEKNADLDAKRKADERADAAKVKELAGGTLEAKKVSKEKGLNYKFGHTKKWGKAEWQAELGKSDDWLDPKNQNARPTSTDEAKKGGKRLKNVGAETPDPAPKTKPVKGNLDEGSGGDVENGKKLDKGASLWGKDKQDYTKKVLPGAKRAVSPQTLDREAEADAAKPPPAGASVVKAAPSMAKPPSGKNPTPSNPPQAKVKTPKAPKLGKGALPMGPRTAANAGAEAAHSVKAGGIPQAPAAAPAPKATPKPASDYADFMPAGKFSGPGAGLKAPAAAPKMTAPTPMMAKKNEEQQNDLAKSLGNCALCGKAEHVGNCSAT